jgi:6-phosphogluconolactonase
MKLHHQRLAGTHQVRAGRRRQLRTLRIASLAASGLVVAAGVPALVPSSAEATTTPSAAGLGAVGAVYVATNAWNGGNRILTFPRYADGSLGGASSAVATGGRGSGPGQFGPIVNDPLGSQNSLIADPSGRYLFVVNAGSGDVSSFAVGRGGPALVDRESSVPRGVVGQSNPFPVSLASTGSALYVLNGIGNSVTGFSVSASGHLNSVQNCALPALPKGNPLDVFPATTLSSQQAVDTQISGQVGLSPDGKWLVVVSKEGPISTTTPPGATGDLFPFGPTSGSGHLYAYPVLPGGRLDCASPRSTALHVFADGNGTFPFSFTWSPQGRLLVTEVFGQSDQPSSLPGGLSAVSSYSLNNDGTFTLQRKVADPLPVPCWIVRSGNNVFVASFLGPDFGLGAISRYQVAADGGLVDPGPATAPTTPLTGGSDPIDVALTSDGRFLYQLAPGPNPGPVDPVTHRLPPTWQVYPFAVTADGSLKALAPVNDGVGGSSAATHSDAGEFGIATVTFK